MAEPITAKLKRNGDIKLVVSGDSEIAVLQLLYAQGKTKLKGDIPADIDAEGELKITLEAKTP